MFYDLVGFLIRLLLPILTRTRVEGVARFPTAGAVLLVSNHLNLIDPPVLGSVLPRRITFMAKEELFKVPVVGWVVGWYGAFAVRRGQADRQAVRTAAEVLRQGGVLGMFPEGTRSRTGRMIAAHPGAAMIALLAGSPVLPIAIDGTDRVKNPLSLLARPKITIRVGEPFEIDRGEVRKTGLEDATTLMMAKVAALLPEDRRGVYSEAAARSASKTGGSTRTQGSGLTADS